MTVLIKHVVLVIIELPSLVIIRKQVTSILLQSITDNSFSQILYLWCYEAWFALLIFWHSLSCTIIVSKADKLCPWAIRQLVTPALMGIYQIHNIIICLYGNCCIEIIWLIYACWVTMHYPGTLWCCGIINVTIAVPSSWGGCPCLHLHGDDSRCCAGTSECWCQEDQAPFLYSTRRQAKGVLHY